jgi:tripartite-type tricarboxylate transporter receptor subunit TctC
LKELGYNIVSTSSLGIIGPKGVPQPIVQKIQEAFKKAMETPEFKGVMKKFDMPITYLSSEDYENFNRQDSERIGKLVKRLGLKKQ